MPVLKACLETKSEKDVAASDELLHVEKNGDFDTGEMTEPGHVNDRKHVNRTHVAASNGRTKQQPQAVYKQKSGYA